MAQVRGQPVTNAELETLYLLGQRPTPRIKEIAEERSVGFRTVKSQLEKLYDKFAIPAGLGGARKKALAALAVEEFDVISVLSQRATNDESPRPPDRLAVCVRDRVIDFARDVPIGRSVAGPGLLASDPYVSRRHCRFIRDEERLYVQDEGSTHGTLVNGRRIERARLHEGDVVQVGQTRLLIVRPSSRTAEDGTA